MAGRSPAKTAKAIFLRPLHLAGRVLEQNRQRRGRKVYSLHAPEVECIGKGKPHRPYEFGVKASIATALTDLVAHLRGAIGRLLH